MAKLEIGKRYWLDETHSSHGALIEILEKDGEFSVEFNDVKGKHPYFGENGNVGFYASEDELDSGFDLFVP